MSRTLAQARAEADAHFDRYGQAVDPIFDGCDEPENTGAKHGAHEQEEPVVLFDDLTMPF